MTLFLDGILMCAHSAVFGVFASYVLNLLLFSLAAAPSLCPFLFCLILAGVFRLRFLFACLLKDCPREP